MIFDKRRHEPIASLESAPAFRFPPISAYMRRSFTCSFTPVEFVQYQLVTAYVWTTEQRLGTTLTEDATFVRFRAIKGYLRIHLFVNSNVRTYIAILLQPVAWTRSSFQRFAATAASGCISRGFLSVRRTESAFARHYTT